MSEPTIVSYSELDTYRQCPLKHHWAYKERWKRPAEIDGALNKGTLWHLVMEEHYNVIKDGGKVPDVYDAIQPYLVEERSGVTSETQDLIRWMWTGYQEKFDIDPAWEILDVEHAFVVPLCDPNGDESPYQLKGKIDLVVRNRANDTYWVVDHKSGANLPDQMDLEIDDQFGLYVWAMNKLGRWPVTGAVHNAARTKMNLADQPGYTGKSKPQAMDQRFRRTYLNRSAVELESIALDAWAVAENAYGSTTPLYSAPDPRQCGWKCDYKEVHLLARKGKDPHDTMRDYGFEQDFTRH